MMSLFLENSISKIPRILWTVVAVITLLSCKQIEVNRIESSSIQIDPTIAGDSSLINEIQPYRDSLFRNMDQVIGHSAIRMDKGFPESLLGNFVTDLMLSLATEKYGYAADFALTNNGGLRVSLPEGDIRLGNIYELMPFENEIVILELKPDVMHQLLGYIAHGEKMSVSGLRMVIRNDSFFQVEINGKALDPLRTYRVVTTDYLADGGSGMSFFEQINKRELVGIRLRDMIIEFIQIKESKGEQLISVLDGRIKRYE